LILRACEGDADEEEADYEAEVSVWQGECDDLSCVDGNLDNPLNSCNVGQGVSWFSELGESYKVLVSWNAVQTGTFGLIARPFNDRCADALPTELFSIELGSTIGGRNDNLPWCGHAYETTSAGVFYTVVSTKHGISSPCTGIL
jgi:hypothetical protein